MPERKPATSRVKKPKKAPAPKKRVVKKVAPKPEAQKVVPIQTASEPRRTYLFAVGKRKTAIARVRYYHKGSGSVLVNKKPLELYFPSPNLQTMIRQPLTLTGNTPGELSIKVNGGGYRSQADSVRHGIARVLLLVDPTYRKVLKPAGLLTRDARVKERKKYGLKRARRAPQWQKR